jgi:hypothetical protein
VRSPSYYPWRSPRYSPSRSLSYKLPRPPNCPPRRPGTPSTGRGPFYH